MLFSINFVDSLIYSVNNHFTNIMNFIVNQLFVLNVFEHSPLNIE